MFSLIKEIHYRSHKLNIIIFSACHMFTSHFKVFLLSICILSIYVYIHHYYYNHYDLEYSKNMNFSLPPFFFFFFLFFISNQLSAYITALCLNEQDVFCPPLSIRLFFSFFYLPSSLSLSLPLFACFRRSNKITSVCCRPTMTKDEKRDREDFKGRCMLYNTTR